MDAPQQQQEKEAVFKTVEEELQCPICLEEFVDPVLLECQHTLCRHDVVALLQKTPQKVECPLCRRVTKVADATKLTPDRLRQRLLEEREQATACQECKRARADEYCADCKVRLCGACMKKTHGAKAFKGHRLVSASQQRQQQQQQQRQRGCGEHGKDFELFCQPHQKALCIDCFLLEHNGHAVASLEEAVKQAKEELRGKLRDLNERKRALHETIQRVAALIGDTNRNVANEMERLNAAFDEMKRRMKECREKAQQRIARIRDEKKSALGSKKATLEEALEQTSACISRMEQIVEQESDAVSVLEAKERVVEQSASLMKKEDEEVKAVAMRVDLSAKEWVVSAIESGFGVTEVEEEQRVAAAASIGSSSSTQAMFNNNNNNNNNNNAAASAQAAKKAAAAAVPPQQEWKVSPTQSFGENVRSLKACLQAALRQQQQQHFDRLDSMILQFVDIHPIRTAVAAKELEYLRDDELIEAVMEGVRNKAAVRMCPSLLMMICLLCFHADNPPLLAKKKGAIAPIKSAMEEEAKDASIQQCCCTVIRELANNNDNRSMIGQSGLIGSIKAAMANHPNDAHVQIEACMALSSMARHNNNDNDNSALIGQSGLIGSIKAAMANHLGHADVQRQACGTLCYLIQNKDNVAQIGQSGLIGSIKAAMANHLGHAAVQEKACMVLFGLSFNDNNKAIMKNEGVVELIKKALAAHPNQGVQTACSHILELISIQTS